MGVLNLLGQVAKNSGRLLQAQAGQYLELDPEARQLTLKRNLVVLLCQRACDRLEQVLELTPADDEGLIAVIQHQNQQIEIKFTPEQMTLENGVFEGRLRLLDKPSLREGSAAFRGLFLCWKFLLGARVPDQVLPEGLRLEGDYLYYQIPRSELQLIDAVLGQLKEQSSLAFVLQQGELQVTSDIAVEWENVNIASLLQIMRSPSSL